MEKNGFLKRRLNFYKEKSNAVKNEILGRMDFYGNSIKNNEILRIRMTFYENIEIL